MLSEGKNAQEAQVAMQEYIQRFRISTVSEGSVAEKTIAQPSGPASSQEMSLRSGPCPGFHHLQSIPWLIAQAEELKQPAAVQRFKDAQSLQTHTDSFEPAQQATTELTKALKAACSHLYQAKIDNGNLVDAVGVARKKAAAKRSAATEQADAAKKAKLAKTAQDHRCVGWGAGRPGGLVDGLVCGM